MRQKLSSPPKEQLVGKWPAYVDALETTVYIQAEALRATEEVFFGVYEMLDTGDHKNACKVLERAYRDISDLMAPASTH